MSSFSENIAVVIPCFNAERYLAAALESVLCQSLPPAEILVVDDGSSDGSCQVAERYAPRVRCVSRQNGGVSSARNAGISLTRAKYLLFLDADDLLLPDALETLALTLAAKPEAGVAFGLFEPFEEQSGKVLPPPPYISQQIEKVPHVPLPGGGYLFTENLFSPLLRGSFIPMGGTMVRRRVFEKVGSFDEEFRVGEDRDLWLRATVVFPFVCVKRVVMRRRLHDSNLTGKRHQQLYHDFNIKLAHKLSAAVPDIKQEDKSYINEKAADCSRISARHFIGEGKSGIARIYVLEYSHWKGWEPETIVLFALTLVPDFVLSLAGRLRGSIATSPS